MTGPGIYLRRFAKFLLLSLAIVIPCHGGAIQLTSPSSLDPSDAAGAYTQPAFSILASPYVLESGSNALIFTRTNGGNFERRDQGEGWQGTFAPGTALLWNRRSPDLDGGSFVGSPVDITFAIGVTEVGFFVQHNSFQFDQTFFISAYNYDNPLGLFTVSGINDPLFIGIRATGPDVITSLFITASSANGIGSDFAMGQITYQAAAIPEPATLLLLGTGLAGVGRMVRRKRQGKS